MKSIRYLIIGGGMTADAAARAIRESDPSGSIGIMSDDPHPPYNRPPLSKGLWKGDDPEKGVARHRQDRRRAAPGPTRDGRQHEAETCHR